MLCMPWSDILCARAAGVDNVKGGRSEIALRNECNTRTQELSVDRLNFGEEAGKTIAFSFSAEAVRERTPLRARVPSAPPPPPNDVFFASLSALHTQAYRACPRFLVSRTLARTSHRNAAECNMLYDPVSDTSGLGVCGRIPSPGPPRVRSARHFLCPLRQVFVRIMCLVSVTMAFATLPAFLPSPSPPSLFCHRCACPLSFAFPGRPHGGRVKTLR